MDGTPSNIREYTVAEISGALKRTIEDAYGYVRVRGELGRVTRAGSGHMYLDLKDDRAVLSAVVWKGKAQGFSIAPEQGMEVIATGRLTTFPGQSRYQMVIDSIEPAGVGALMALLEERKKKLAAEGLFAEERKRALPFLPETIGVVTSPSGAVIRDILHRLRDRFPRHVIVWPTRVQGKGAEVEIASAIAGFNALEPGGDVPRPDVLIVARGGGSLEDLWCFNEEIVVRAAAASRIPLISAVGHETDTTLIDFASDRRAPTPTAAAEIAVPVRSELVADVLDFERRLVSAMGRAHEARRAALVSAGRGLGRPEDAVEFAGQRLDGAGARLSAAARARLDGAEGRLGRAAARVRPAAVAQGIAAKAARLEALAERLAAAARRGDERRRERLARARISDAALKSAAARGGERMAELSRRTAQAAARRLARETDALSGLSKLLKSLSHEGVLQRGFALVRGDGGTVVRSARALADGAAADVVFVDGTRRAVFVGGTPGASKSPAKSASKTANPKRGAAQAGLFDE